MTVGPIVPNRPRHCSPHAPIRSHCGALGITPPTVRTVGPIVPNRPRHCSPHTCPHSVPLRGVKDNAPCER